MRMHNFRHGGGGQLAWTVDKNCILVGVASLKSVVISSDPAMTLTSWINQPLGSVQVDEMYISIESTGTVTQLLSLLNFELLAGQQVYSNVSAAANVQLYLQDF
jgi:hypothetical protein